MAGVPNRECHLLRGVNRLCVAHAAGQLPAVEDGAYVFLGVEAQWTVGTHQRRPSSAGAHEARATRAPQCWGDR